MPPSRPNLRPELRDEKARAQIESATATPLSGIRQRPLLASEALKEDVAPLEPAARTARWLAVSMALVLGAIGGASYAGLTPSYPSLAGPEALAAAGLLAIVAAVPVHYVVRAGAMAVVGALLLAEGLFGRGPAAALARSHGATIPWETARVLAATLLPAALLFRAWYRAFPRARHLLAAALVVAAPYVVRAGWLVAQSGPLPERIAGGATVACVLVSLVGFMGSETNAMGSAWATALVGIVSADVALRQVFPRFVTRSFDDAATALAFLAGTALASLGIFQLAAVVFGPEAREIDVSKHEEPPEAQRNSEA